MTQTLIQIGKQVEICERKTIFASKRKAVMHADRGQWKQHPYRCPICDMWHLTSQGEETRRGA